MTLKISGAFASNEAPVPQNVSTAFELAQEGKLVTNLRIDCSDCSCKEIVENGVKKIVAECGNGPLGIIDRELALIRHLTNKFLPFECLTGKSYEKNCATYTCHIKFEANGMISHGEQCSYHRCQAEARQREFELKSYQKNLLEAKNSNQRPSPREQCPPGTNFTKDCNSCECKEMEINGFKTIIEICTNKPCSDVDKKLKLIEHMLVHKEVNLECLTGSSYKENCNSCHCSVRFEDDGTVAIYSGCTKMGCVKTAYKKLK